MGEEHLFPAHEAALFGVEIRKKIIHRFLADRFTAQAVDLFEQFLLGFDRGPRFRERLPLAGKLDVHPLLTDEDGQERRANRDQNRQYYPKNCRHGVRSRLRPVYPWYWRYHPKVVISQRDLSVENTVT